MNRKLFCVLFLSLSLALFGCSDDDGGGGTDDTGGTTADTAGGDTGGTADTGGTDDTGGTADTGGTDDTGGGGDTSTDPQPRGADNMPTMGAQIDRMGRPAISTALIMTFSGDDAAKNDRKDAYNAAAAADWAGFQANIAGSLGILDSLDTDCGNQLLADDGDADGRYNGLAGVLVDDQLYVHADRGTCGTYLGLEAEVVGVLDPDTGGCGGRTPADDVIDRTYSAVAAGLLTGVDDTITENDVDFLDAFPYLAPPHN